MSDNGKGHARRPQFVDDGTFAENWERTFGPKPPDYSNSIAVRRHELAVRLTPTKGANDAASARKA